jgi:hypothetical protein
MKEQTLSGWERGSGGKVPSLGMKEQTLREWEQGSGGENPQFGDDSPPVRLVRLG